MKKLTQDATPKHLQLVFLFTILGTAAYSAADMLYRVFAQYPSNQNLGSFMGMLVGSFLYPALLVLVSYLLITRKISSVQKLYESVIVAIIGICLFTLTNYIFIGLTGYLGLYESVWNSLGAFWTWSVEALPSLLLVLIYLLAARKKAQW